MTTKFLKFSYRSPAFSPSALYCYFSRITWANNVDLKIIRLQACVGVWRLPQTRVRLQACSGVWRLPQTAFFSFNFFCLSYVVTAGISYLPDWIVALCCAWVAQSSDQYLYQ